MSEHAIDPGADAFETEPDTPTSWGRVATLIGPLFRGQWAHFAGCFVLLVVASGLTVAGPLLVKRAIDRDIAGGDWRGLQVTVALYLGTQLLHLAVFYVMRNWLEWTGQRMMAALKSRLFRHLMRLPLAFYDRNPAGKLLSRVENDTESLRMLFTTTSVMLLGDLLLFVGMFAAMAAVHLRLTVVVALVLPVLAVLTLKFHKIGRPYFLAYRGLTAELCGRLAEFLQGMPVIQAFERRRWAMGNFQTVNRRRFDVAFRAEFLWLGWSNTVVFMEFTAFALILGVGGYWALAGSVTIGTLAMFMGYVRRFFEPLLRLSEQIITIQKAMAGAERIFRLLEEPVRIADAEETVPWPGLRHRITFEDVWFRYSDEGDWVLEDVSFTMPAGERWALVGATGSGKTTIVSLLLRFYEPQRGRILVDGVDIRRISQEDLRRNIGLVLQDLYLFPGDLAMNLTLGRPVSEDRLREAARESLAADLIDSLPGGYASEIAERGGNLSMGERQLLSFTRAVMHRPALLVLDEATSAIDPVTEASIERSLRRILAGRSALIVAHRLSTIRGADHILVLDRGRIVERGDHRSLLARAGVYRKLHELQFKEEGHVEAELAG
jgi:ATP-binding cassette subfamily B protein